MFYLVSLVDIQEEVREKIGREEFFKITTVCGTFMV
jgi:hypothetical protein